MCVKYLEMGICLLGQGSRLKITLLRETELGGRNGSDTATARYCPVAQEVFRRSQTRNEPEICRPRSIFTKCTSSSQTEGSYLLNKALPLFTARYTITEVHIPTPRWMLLTTNSLL